MTQLQDILTPQGIGEHRGEDGLAYCDKCGSRREMVLPLSDPPRKVRCICKCQVEALEQHREAFRAREEQDRFQRLRSAAMTDPALRHNRFSNSVYQDGPVAIARNYAEHWPRMREAGSGLLLWGSPGTGKTFLASCIANELADRQVPVLMTSFSRILGSLPGPASGEQTAAIDALMGYPLLIIDDLGVERDTPYAMEQVFHLIDARYRSKLPMIITTNLTMQELENPDTREKQRIYSRVLERCTPVQVEGRPIRAEKQRENRSFARAHLT